MMNYSESVLWLEGLSRFGISPGLERVEALTKALGSPEGELRFIHVAGTNGKGSVCSMLSCMLTHAGCKTGLFSSPCVFGVREQLRLDGEYISENAFAALLSTVRSAAEGLYKKNIVPTMFETLTACALLYFKQQKCDFVIMECGMGGRLDSTNVIPAPELCVFTSVSLDHTAFLGDTVEKIAVEKCGIIKNGCTVVSYPEKGNLGFIPQSRTVAEVIRGAAKEKDCPVHFADASGVRVVKTDMFSSDIDVHGVRLHIPFGGAHQIANALTAYECARLLGASGEGIEKAYMAARLEKLSDAPLIILDGGHNPGCAKAVSAFIKEKLSSKKIVFLSALMKDKDFDETFGRLLPFAECAVFTEPENPRSESAVELMNKALPYCNDVCAVKKSEDALKIALEKTGANGVLMICGSFYLAAEVRKFF